MSEAKACPFCGEPAEKLEGVELGYDYPLYGCIEPDCPCSEMPFVRLEEWDDRPIEDALNARIAKLVNLVEVQHDDNCHLADMCRQRDASIAELEATIDQLIAAGESLTRVAEWRYANLTELLAWDTLVEKIHKEREK